VARGAGTESVPQCGHGESSHGRSGAPTVARSAVSHLFGRLRSPRAQGHVRIARGDGRGRSHVDPPARGVAGALRPSNLATQRSRSRVNIRRHNDPRSERAEAGGRTVAFLSLCTRLMTSARAARYSVRLISGRPHMAASSASWESSGGGVGRLAAECGSSAPVGLARSQPPRDQHLPRSGCTRRLQARRHSRLDSLGELCRRGHRRQCR
jgi:hypothetical protein